MYSVFYFTGGIDPRKIAQSLSVEGKTHWTSAGELLVTRIGDDESPESSFRFVFQSNAGRALHALTHRAFDLLIVDVREGIIEECEKPFLETNGGKLLSSLLGISSTSYCGVRKRNILVILSDDNKSNYSFEAGKLKIGGILVEPFKTGGLLKAILPYLKSFGGGKIALCLAGGGVEGLIYELGVLMALDRVMKNRKVRDFDIFCGISAGAFISAFLANGVGSEEIVKGLHRGTGKIDKINRLTIFYPNWNEIIPRIFRVVGYTFNKKNIDIETLVWGLVPSGAMNNEYLRVYLEKQLTKPGMTNNFNQLKKELYIGVTEQDTSNHVVFGETGAKDIPISDAVVASSALVPFYRPKQIKDKWFIDGAFTRTANVSVAARHGARLIIVVNPWVPFKSREPGVAMRLGGAFTTLQAIKTLVSARFFHDYENVDELFPDSAIHLFYPEGDELTEMKGTLMKFFYRMKLVDIAYRRTIQKIRDRYELIVRDFKKFGIELEDLSTLEEESVLKKITEEEKLSEVEEKGLLSRVRLRKM